MKINKSQDQTIFNIGIYLRKPVFNYRQLYVVLSKVKSSNNAKVFIINERHSPFSLISINVFSSQRECCSFNSMDLVVPKSVRLLLGIVEIDYCGQN